MQNILLVIHLIACLALVIAVLLQRSEGGALGMGGGGTGGVISGRGAASVLVRTTMILAGTFIVTSLLMTRLNAEAAKTPSDIQRELEQRNKQDPLAIGAIPPSTTPAATPAPAPATVDPLAPITTPGLNLTPAPAAPAPATTTPPATTTAPATTPKPVAPKPAAATPAPAPATTTPAAPATSPTTPAQTPPN